MLNDLYAIERGLMARGIGLTSVHPDVKDMAKGPAFRLRIDADGKIADVALIADAGRGAVWTLRDGQHNGFPGLRTKAGLIALDAAALANHDAIWKADKTPSGRRTELLRLATSFPLAPTAGWPEPGHRRRIAERLDALRPLAADPSSAAVPAAFERFLVALDAEPPLLEQLAKALIAALTTQGDDWLDPIRTAFIGQAALAIDIPVADFPRNAGDARQISPVSAALGAAAGAIGHNGGVCALSGARGPLHSGNFPQPNLPGLGQVYLFSRNPDIPSLGRYGRISDKSFAVGAGLAQRLSGAIAALTKPDAQNQTWGLIPGETGDKPDLLVASFALVADLTQDEEEDDKGDAPNTRGVGGLSDLGARMFEQLGADRAAERDALDEISILVLRTVDPANRKAIYHRKAKPADIAAAADNWRRAAANTPADVGFKMPQKGKTQPVFRRPPLVAPLSLTPLSRMLFANGGRRRVDIGGAPAAEAFGLFLREGDATRRTRKLLTLMLRRLSPLLAGLAAARSAGVEALKHFDPKLDLRRDALRGVAWFGVLLHFLGRTKEVYMSDAAFRLGQLLSAADALHVGYCADLRGGAVPPTLVGNAVFSIALGDPTRALAVLAQRLKPYLGWAGSGRLSRIREKAEGLIRGGDPSRGYAMLNGASQARRADELSIELRALLAPYHDKGATPDDAFKAELLLGYLAGLPKREKQNAPSDQTSDITKGETA